jgi:glycosyltransferase involved in cell wall biosynthesis
MTDDRFRLSFMVEDTAFFLREWGYALRQFAVAGMHLEMVGPPGLAVALAALDPTLASVGVKEIPISPGPGALIWAPVAVARWVEFQPHLVHVVGDAILPPAVEAARLARAGAVVCSYHGAKIGYLSSVQRLVPSSLSASIQPAGMAARALSARATRIFAMSARAASALESAGVSTAGFERFEFGLGLSLDRWRGDDGADKVLPRPLVRDASTRMRVAVDVRGLALEEQKPALALVRRLRSGVAGLAFVVLTDTTFRSPWDHERDVLALNDGPDNEALAIASCDALLLAEGHASARRLAMAAALMRLPIVALQSPDTAGLVRHDETGYVVDGGTLASWETAIRALADSPGLRAQMGARATRYATRLFDADLVLQRVVGLYDRLLSEGADDEGPATLDSSGTILSAPARQGLNQHIKGTNRGPVA